MTGGSGPPGTGPGGTSGPLAGRRVLVTRAAGEGRSLAEAIRRLGGESWEVPVIAIAGPPDPDRVAVAAARVAGYGWVVFTSRHGVERLLGALEAAGPGAAALRGCRLVAVGPATARALEARGLGAVRLPDAADAGGVLRLLLEEVRPGERVLVVRPLEAAMDLATPLRAAGAEVDEVVAYQTVPALAPGELARVLRERPVHYVTFTSGSTVRAFLEAAGGPGALEGVRVACIGPRTAEAAERLGLTVHVVGPGHSVEALAEAIGADAARHAGEPWGERRRRCGIVAVENIRVGAGFPAQRPRRLRAGETIRRLVQETRLGTDDLIYPLFVVPGTGVREEIDAMPGQYHLSVDMLLRRVEESLNLGVRACILFGIPEHKDATGSSAFDPQGPVQRAIREIKARFPEVYVITDVCLCEYTDHGHCGVVHDGRIDNDPTLDLLAREALSHAEAGADMVAPSDMMDGRVAAIRRALDENGFEEIPIMAYSAKYASAYYGPFRVAAQSAPQFGDRRSYQMDPPNAREALKEVELDIAEGADIVMVKPALAYLDVLWRVKEATKVPVACYNVSGEYAMVKAAAQRGWIDERRVVLETLTGMKRAGADLILTYHALDVARWLKEDR